MKIPDVISVIAMAAVSMTQLLLLRLVLDNATSCLRVNARFMLALRVSIVTSRLVFLAILLVSSVPALGHHHVWDAALKNI